MISLGASARIVEPVEGMRTWVFKTPQSDAMMAAAVAQDMADQGHRTVAFIGFNDAFGDSWWAEFQKYAEVRKLKLVAYERYGRTDTSVTAQVLKVISANPDAVLIAAYGTPAALPQITLRERGYRGPTYHGHGILTNDFLRVAGASANGIRLPAGPLLVARDLPDTNPVRKVALDYIKRYEGVHGEGSLSAFGGHAWDAILLANYAIPIAAKQAKPGTVEFRKALRDALEGAKNVVGTHGVFNMSAQDHLGLDQRARVMIRIDGGKWRLASP
jgi:branched-chain amino acid transport system substrate-binding protein